MSTDVSVGLGEFKLLERFVVAMERIATKLGEIAPSTDVQQGQPAICPQCNGTGSVYSNALGNDIKYVCPTCTGKQQA